MPTTLTIEKEEDLYLFCVTIKNEDSESSLCFTLEEDSYVKLKEYLNSDNFNEISFDVSCNSEENIIVNKRYVQVFASWCGGEINPYSRFKFRKELYKQKMNLL